MSLVTSTPTKLTTTRFRGKPVRAGIVVDWQSKTNQAPFRSDIGGRPQEPEYAAPMGLKFCWGYGSTKMPRLTALGIGAERELSQLAAAAADLNA